MPTYSYSSIKTAVNGKIHNKIGLITDPRTSINNSLLELWQELDLRSAKRATNVSPNLFSDVYDYACPSDLKGMAIVDLVPQVNRSKNFEIDLVTVEEFDRRKSVDRTIVAFSDADFVRKLRVAATVSDDTLVVSPLDTITSNGTWAAFGDGTNLTTDNDNYVEGSGSINWDISAAAGTTAGITASDVTTFDITDYIASGSVFVWQYITSTTNLTNFIIRLGSDSSNYYSMTATTASDGTAFTTGWQLIRFDFSGATQTGTVVPASCDYVAFYMTKTSAKVSETDYRTDHIMLKRGEYHKVIYYSKYPWQSSGGTYKENSTLDSDLLNVDSDEYPLVVTKVSMDLAQEAREYKDHELLSKKYEVMLREYKMTHPSEARLLQTTRYRFASIDGDFDAGSRGDFFFD